MLQKDNKVYLNLEEQVLKNKDDIENISSINGLLGIKVVNQVESEGDLPAEASAEFEALEYGDAYVVVNDDDTYTFYVKTRPTTEKEYDHWFELHLEGIQGPIGPEGPKGETGEKGAVGILAVDTNDVNTLRPADYDVNQSVMTTNGNVYRNTGSSWRYLTNIRGVQGVQGQRGETGSTGPQGVPGIQGPKGDPGGFIDIRGRVSSTMMLPTPPEHGYDAYFVGTATPAASNPLYVWTDDGWASIGVLNVATYVVANGEFVGQWDSDTKVDKITANNKVYATNASGGQENLSWAYGASSYSVAVRGVGGVIVAGDPIDSLHVVNKRTMEAALPKIIRI